MASVDFDETLKQINQWVVDLDSINISDLHPKVKSEFLLIAEETSKFTKIVKMLEFYSKITTNGKILTISIKDVYDFVNNCSNRLRHWDDDFYLMSLSACSEAHVYILIEKPIPVDLLVKLIKLKMISVINEIIYVQKMVVTLRQQMDYLQPPIGEKGETKKKGKKKKDKASKSKGSKSKAKKGKENISVVNPCLDYQYAPIENFSPDENVDIPTTFVYIALIGFYVPNLIPFCSWNGMQFQCVIKFGETSMKCKKFSSETTLDSILYDEDYLILKANVKYAPKPEIHKKKEQILLQFWQRLDTMYNVERPEYVKHSFIMNYNPLFFSINKRNMKVYLHQCERVYEDFSEFVGKLTDYKRQYNTYLDSMKVYQLDVETKKIDVRQMKIYNNAMDALPIDTISISLILDNLIHEISHREVQSVISLNTHTCSTDNIAKDVQKQSHYLQLEDEMCHRTLRDHLKNIFLHFKATRCRYISRKADHIGNFKPCVNTKPYITHENNLIEMTLNYYKFLPLSVLNTLVTYLKKNPCTAALADLPPLADDVISHNKKEIQEWCTLMKFDESDLILSLSVILIGLFVRNEIDLSSEESLHTEHFPVQKTPHEIQANIWNKGSRRALPCIEQTNPYQKISPLDMRWVDRLPPIVALQELARASEQFECVDYRHIEILDTMLYRFHHNVDEFGITTRFWKENIRSPVSLNDFMTYAVHADISNIVEQEERHKDEIELCHNIKYAVDNMSDFSTRSEDFLIPGSFKTNYVEEVRVATETTEKKGKKGKTKGTKEASKKSKSKSAVSSNKKKNKKVDAFDARTIVEDEPVQSDVNSYECDYAILKEEDPPRRIPAVNFNGLLLTSNGITTSFYSMDDLKVIIDQVQICDEETKLSAKVSLNGHDLIVHREKKEEFSFHVNFKSGVVLACGSPTTYSTSTENDFYLMTEESDNVVSCMRSLFQSKKDFAMSDNILQRFIKNNRYNTSKQTSYTSVLSKNIASSNGRKWIAKESFTSASNMSADRRRKNVTPTRIKTQDVILPIQSMIKKPVECSAVSLYNESNFTKRGFSSEVKLLKKYINELAPKFKVFSSRLHKYNFLKRITTPVEMDLNEIIRFVARTKRESKYRLSVKKRFSIKRKSAGNYKTAYDYDFRVTLPNGLHLRNVVGDRGTSICQYYFQKGATSAPIFDEDCRLFLGNGTVTVKKDNGKFIIYCANGEIIKYETAFLENTRANTLFQKNRDPNNEIPNFLKRVRKNLYNLTKNHRQSNYIGGRRMWKKQVKRFFCEKKKHVPFSTIKFTFTTSDGRVIYYKNGTITESSGYYVEKEDLIKMGQVIFRREDGTTSILTDEGHMQSTFSDGTKITVWCEIDSEPVIVNLRDMFGPDCEDMGPFVNIVTCYQYEHPHYITLLSNGPDEKLMMRIASGEIFDITNRHFLIGIDEWTTLLANKEVIRFVGTPCDKCGKSCECDIDIKQLYSPTADDDNGRVFLKVCDTYNKSFIVHYDGSSERNEDYIIDKNQCCHHSHKTQPCQAFFTLNRDFSGCALWTNDDYNKRLSEADDADTNYVVLYVDKPSGKILSTEWKTFEKQHYNFRFNWPQMETYKVDANEFDISTAAFVKQRIVKKIPKNKVTNLIRSIFNQNIDLFSFSRAEVKKLLSSTKTSLLPSVSNIGIRMPRSYEKALFERKIKTKNKECDDIVDKIIEYFVKKTGRYYRTKVYENFCGVKLMLDDEEEIFFLASFDTSSVSSTIDSVSESSAKDENVKQNLSLSMELMRTRLCKSTSAVQTAVEVIKQLEMERQRENKPKPSYEALKSLLEKTSHQKLKGLQKSTSHPKVGDAVVKKPSSRLISIVGPLDLEKSIHKMETKTSMTGVDHPASILKSSHFQPKDAEERPSKIHPLRRISSPFSNSVFVSECDISLHPHSTEALLNKKEISSSNEQPNDKPENETAELSKIIAETQPEGKSEETKMSQTNLPQASSIHVEELAIEQDIDAVCNLISQTLKRIRQEKFGDTKTSDDDIPSENDLYLERKRTGDSSSLIMSINSEPEFVPLKTTILRDLFNVSRDGIATVAEEKSSNKPSSGIDYKSAADNYYSNFSLRDIGLAECEQFLGDAQGAKESTVSLTRRSSKRSTPNQDTSYSSKKHSVGYFPDHQMQKEYYMTLEHMQERSLSSMSSTVSVEEPADSHTGNLAHTPSMIPLVNIKSLTMEHSVPNMALMSVLSFMSGQSKTPSMRVLRSMTELEKDYEFVIVENTGIVTDKNITKEVQTDIVYEDFRDDELE